MRRGFASPNCAGRSERRNSTLRQSVLGRLRGYRRRLVIESLEDRRLLTVLSVSCTRQVSDAASGFTGTLACAPASAGAKSTPAPMVTALSPNSGPDGGGTAVMITGINLEGATEVRFGNSLAAITSDAATSIEVTTPAEPAGTVYVTVTTAGGTSTVTSFGEFTYVTPPTLTTISPTSGPTAGGTPVTITGTNLTGEFEVLFGSVWAAVTSDTANQIVATSPAEPAGMVYVTVITAGGTSTITSNGEFTYVQAPAVAGLIPTSGSTTGGTSVTIAGTNLAGATAVRFGNVLAAVTSDTANQIVATSPAGSGTVDVTVTTGGGTSATSAADWFTYEAAPTVTGVSPTSGPTAGGIWVTIAGTNLAGATAVLFGGVAATTITSDAANQIVAVNPAGAGTVDVTVTTAGGTSATSAADEFTYAASTSPTVASISPDSGPAGGGTNVTITGTNLTGATAVEFGGAAATNVAVDSATQITATSPAGSGTVNVIVTTPNGTSPASPSDLFTYLAAPTVTAISPTAGPVAGGTTVTITGTNLAGVTAVNFGGAAATKITSDKGTKIVATSPAESAGTVDVTVTAPQPFPAKRDAMWLQEGRGERRYVG